MLCSKLFCRKVLDRKKSCKIAVQHIWQIQESQDQILALASRSKILDIIQMLTLRSKLALMPSPNLIAAHL